LCNRKKLSGAKLQRAFEDRPQIVAVPAPTLDELASQVRAERDMKIAETDYLAMPDYPLSDEDKAAVMAYRQALRDRRFPS